MRVLADTNILFSAIIRPNSIPAQALLKITEEHTLVLCDQNLTELRDVFQRKAPKFLAVVETFLMELSYELIPAVKQTKIEMRDPKDQPILNAAALHDVDIIVTGDKDFLALELDKPECMTASDFMEKHSAIINNKNDIIAGQMTTERLVLRRWEESDAESLYEYAKDPDVGPIAGWPPHKSVEESLDIIKNVFCGEEAYAVCLKKDDKAIGAIELKLKGHTDMTERDDECELGYWIGKPFWGQGLIPEAAKEIIRHGFEDLGMRAIWCGYYDGNEKSKRVQEKLGFKYQWTTKDLDVPLMNEKRTGHVSLLMQEDWRG